MVSTHDIPAEGKHVPKVYSIDGGGKLSSEDVLDTVGIQSVVALFPIDLLLKDLQISGLLIGFSGCLFTPWECTES